MPAPILKKKLLAAMIASAVVATSALPTLALAQTADANLRGKAPANSEITARNVATGAVRRTKASAEGAYSLVGLPVGVDASRLATPDEPMPAPASTSGETVYQDNSVKVFVSPQPDGTMQLRAVGGDCTNPVECTTRAQ